MTPEDLNSLAAEFDIDQLAAVPANPVPVDAERFGTAIADLPADLGYIRRGLSKRLNPDLVLPGVKSILVGLISYAGGPERPSPLPPDTGWISRYAWGQDYHDVAGRRFNALAEALKDRYGASTRWYVDTGPVVEKAWAAAAGLGFQGKNTLLVSPEFGSFVFLGVVLTDIEVTGSTLKRVPEGCGNCKACVNACPTGALDGRGGLDRSRCLAHLTASSKSPIPENIDPAGNIYGCDICQDVCPFNAGLVGSGPGKSGRPACRSEFLPRPNLFCPSLEWVLNMDDDAFALAFKGSPVFRRGRQAVQNTTGRLRHPDKNEH